MTTELESVLHHYTSIENMKSIIENQSLHFTHSEYTNDPTEIEFGREYFRRLYFQALDEQIDQKILFKYNALEEYQKFNVVFSSEKRTLEPYLFSLCSISKENDIHDDGLLSMWRSYAIDGCAIEFDQNILS